MWTEGSCNGICYVHLCMHACGYKRFVHVAKATGCKWVSYMMFAQSHDIVRWLDYENGIWQTFAGHSTQGSAAKCPGAIIE